MQHEMNYHADTCRYCGLSRKDIENGGPNYCSPREAKSNMRLALTVLIGLAFGLPPLLSLI